MKGRILTFARVLGLCLLVAILSCPISVSDAQAGQTCTGSISGGDDTGPALVFEDELDELIGQVQALIDSRVLNPGQGNALLSKIVGARRSLEQGETYAAVDKLNAFINQVNDLVDSGQLSPSQGQPLIDAAVNVRGAIVRWVSYPAGAPIRIASALALSGPFEFVGVDELRGIEIALGFRGSLFAHPFELTTYDSGCSYEGGEAAAQAIVSDPAIVAAVGTSCSVAARGAVPIFSSADYVMVSPSATAPFLTDPDTREPSFWRVAWNDRGQSHLMAEFAWDNLSDATSAVIYDGSAYSQALAQAFVDRFAELGGQNLAFVATNPDGSEVRKALATVVDVGPPDLLFFPVLEPLGSAIVARASRNPRLRETNLAATDALLSADFLEAKYAEGVYLTGPEIRFTELYPAFYEAYLNAYYEEPMSPFHAYAFDATSMILDAIERAGAVDGDGTLHIDRWALRHELSATVDMRGTTGTITCNPYGDCGGTGFVVKRIESGELVPP
jgi:branched-chain amino acid transport system substrate-binding protein